MFTGRLPDPSRSWVTYESDFDLTDPEFYDKIRPAVDRACSLVEASSETRNGRPQSVPRGQVSSVRVIDAGGMQLRVEAVGEWVRRAESSSKPVGADTSMLCFQCHANWTRGAHPSNHCPVADAQHVMES